METLPDPAEAEIEEAADCVNCGERLSLEERAAGDMCEGCVNAGVEP
jgi:formylmethanofuran dehydrogenase subunit E